MLPHNDLGLLGFDHIEFAVSDLEKSLRLYEQMGFEKLGSRKIFERDLESVLVGQNSVRILLSHSTKDSDPVAQHVLRHGDGVVGIAFLCQDAFSTLEKAANRGATITEQPRAMEKDFGSVQQASIAAFEDLRHTFISRTGSLFAEGFEAPCLSAPTGFGIEKIASVSAGLEKGQMEKWTSFYEQMLGLKKYAEGFWQTADGAVKMSALETHAENDPVQAFLKVNHGPGIQWITLQTGSLPRTVQGLAERSLLLAEMPDHAFCTEHVAGSFYYRLI